MTVIDVCGVVGTLLAVGAALDFALSSNTKKRFSGFLLSVTARQAAFSYRGTAVLDKIFGPGLLSKRSILRYMGISISSMCVSYAIAWATTPDNDGHPIAIFPGPVTLTAAFSLIICVAFAALGDVASYSITRLFIRTVDVYRSRTVSLGLIIADIIVSLSLFFISFSVAKALCYSLIFYTSNLPPLKSDVILLPNAIKSEITSFGSAGVPKDTEEPLRLAVLIENAQTENELRKLKEAWIEREPWSLAGSRKQNIIDYKVATACAAFPKDISSLAKGLQDTNDFLVPLASAQNELRQKKISSDDLDNLIKPFLYAPSSVTSKCGEPIIAITREISTRKLIAVAGPIDTYLAAAERTLFDAYQITGFKLSPYVYFDPLESTSEFVESLKIIMTTTFLGIASPDPSKVATLDKFPARPEKPGSLVHIPFSPMAASSLTSSLFFLLYLGALFVAMFRSQVVLGLKYILPSINLDKAAFTTLGLALSCVVVLVCLITWLADSAWLILFGA